VFVAVVVIGVTFAIAVVQKTQRMTPMRLLDSFEQTARTTVGLSATAAAAGIIIGAIFSSGLSYTVAQFAVESAGGQIWLVLVIAAVMALIMGMGMTAAAVYITLAATVIPILIKAGISPMAAHFFAFYFGNVSNITPPVALAAYAAAPIAGASPMATGWQATRLGAASFLLPFLFIYGPALLMEGAWYETIQVTFTAALGLTSIALAITGYFMTTVPVWQRVIFFASSIFLIEPSLITDAIGVGLFVVAAGSNWWMSRRAPAPARITRTVEAAPATRGSMARLWDRFVAKRMEKEADGQPISAPTNVEEPRLDNLTETLMRDVEGPGAGAEVTRRHLWFAWGWVLAGAIALEVMGQTYMHARYPLLWVAAIAAIAFVTLIGVARCWAAGQRARLAA